MSPIAPSQSPESQGVAPEPAKIYSVGTLRYDKNQLFVLFFWLMWNDFSIMLIEQIGGLNNVLMKNHGASFFQIQLLATIAGILTPWINPWVSTWSDRHRGNHGRRRPFLFIATPFFAFFLAITPYMPDLFHFVQRFPAAESILSRIPMDGSVLFIGVCAVVSGLFNAVVMAIFSYLYWDVVPDPLQGRFQSMSKNATLIAGLVWSFFIYGLADHHMKAVYVGTAAFALLVYLVSVWQIKEGEYPPPDVRTKGGILAPIRAYCVECFSQSYYLWVFVAALFFQLGNKGNDFQWFYLYSDLHLDLSTIGWATGWSKTVTAGFGLVFGFAVGSLTDRLKPVRLMAPLVLAMALINLASFFFIHDKWTYLIASCGLNMVIFALGTATGAFTIEVFPREKLGQFCSANAVFSQCLINPLGPLIGMFFDYVKNNRLGYLWTAAFYLLSALAYVKVYFNWKARKGKIPVPHAG